MLSAMMIKVYQTDSNADSFNDCIAQGFRFANQSDYQTVMRQAGYGACPP